MVFLFECKDKKKAHFDSEMRFAGACFQEKCKGIILF